MRALRSRTATSTSDSSVNTSLSKITKKKSRKTRKSQLSISKSSVEASDAESASNVNEKSTNEDKIPKKSTRKTRNTAKQVEISENANQSKENEDKSCNSESTMSESEPVKKSRRTRKRRSKEAKSETEAEVQNEKNKKTENDNETILKECLDESAKFKKLADNCKNKSLLFDISKSEMMEGLSKLDSSSSCDEKNKTLTQEQSCIIVNDTLEASKINNTTFDTKNATFERSQSKKNTTFEKKNNTTFDKSYKNNTTFEKKNITFDKNTTFEKKNGTFNVSTNKNTTFDKNGSFEKINTTFEKLDNELMESRNRRSSRRDTYQIKNSSGQWKVDDISLDDSTDRVTLHKDKKPASNKTVPELTVWKEDCETHNNVINDKSISEKEIIDDTLDSPVERITLHKNKVKKATFNLLSDDIAAKSDKLNDTFDTPSKSNRKKWVKFDNDTVIQSPILRKSNTFINKSATLCSSTPFTKTYPLTPGRLNKSRSSLSKNKSLIEISSTSKSIKKSGRKPGTMPNFALIHKKANEKIESIKEYSERKKERAEKLLSGQKPDDATNIKNNVVKSSAELFKNVNTKLNKSNKSKTPEKSLTSIVTKKMVSRIPELKSKPVKNKENKKEPPVVPKIIVQEPSILEDSNKVASKTDLKIKKPVGKFVLKENQNTPKILPKLSKSVLTENKSTIDLRDKLNSSKKQNKTIDSLNKPNVRPIITKPTTINLNKSKTEKPASIFSKGHFHVGNVEVKQVEAKEEKPVSVFSKGHYQAIANKVKTKDKLANRDNRRDQLKGVRTNRRFELLMQMRNNN